MNTTTQNIQLALDFPHRPSLGREDFLVTACNREAVQLVENWPNWSYFAICIYGAESSGKTHLANVFANNVANLTNYPYKIPFIKAHSINMDNFRPLFSQHQCLTTGPHLHLTTKKDGKVIDPAILIMMSEKRSIE